MNLKLHIYFIQIEFKTNCICLALQYYPKSSTLIDEADRITEKLSEIVYFVIVKVTTVCAVLLKPTFVFFIYFTTDLGRDAFELPGPLW